MITGKELSQALLRRQLSAKDFGRQIGKAESTIYTWCREGVPEKYEKTVGGGNWLKERAKRLREIFVWRPASRHVPGYC